jgi:hypothetical protein
MDMEIPVLFAAVELVGGGDAFTARQVQSAVAASHHVLVRPRRAPLVPGVEARQTADD